MVQILRGTNGSEADLEKGTEKELMFVGGPTKEFSALQESLLFYGIYPSSLELGTLSTIGGLMD